MSKPLEIDYFTDILCIWAWISQRRLDELTTQWDGKIIIRPHYLDLFGDTATRIGKDWQAKGGFEGFGRHVVEAAAPYEHAAVHGDIWKQTRPKSSASTHLMLKAVEGAYSPEIALSFARRVRTAFFVETLDIGDTAVLTKLATEHGLDTDLLNPLLSDGTAAASLMRDYQDAKSAGLKGSPSWLMNSGRQTLFGNVGYKILDANIREILERPNTGASWC